MRVLHLPSSHLPDTVGGTETYVDNLCRALVALGHEPAVAIHVSDGSVSQHAAQFPYAVHRLPAHLPKRRRDVYERSADVEPPGFAQLLAAWRPELIHFHASTLGAGHDHAATADRLGIPYLLTYHTPAISCPRGTMLHLGAQPCDGRMDARRCAACTLDSRGWPSALARLAGRSPFDAAAMPDGPWIARLALPSVLQRSFDRLRQFLIKCARIVACANWCRDVLIVNGVSAEKIVVLRQAIEGQSRMRTLRLPPTPKEGLRIGYFGRICKIKGPDVLLDALAYLRQRRISAMCELVGPVQADEASWFQRRLDRERRHARHLGVLRGDELTRWLDSIDLLAIPSRWLETGPLTLLEAWDRGLPAIGSDRGGIADFLAAAGLQSCAFEAESPASLAAAVERMSCWPGAAPSVQVRGFAQLACEMLQVYDEALDCQRSSAA